MSKRKLMLLAILMTAILIGGFAYANFAQKRESDISPVLSDEPAKAPRLATLADNLEAPWALAFLPASPTGGTDKNILFTERPGRVRIIDNKGVLKPNPIAVISDVKAVGEGGLLGITIDPEFSNNHFIYLYYTYAEKDNQTMNRVVRFKFENNRLLGETIIVDKIPGALFHNGGRIKFGPDEFLYITTGDSQNPSLAQDINSLAGKILRVDRDGKPAPGNPFGNLTFSYGHRNPQGIAWDKDNNLWETEHGPSGIWPNCCQDELNLIQAGKNYGWPLIMGDQTRNGLQTPIANSGSDIWAPGGTAYLSPEGELNGSIFFTGLRGQAIYKTNIDKKEPTIKEYLKGELGRVREITVGPDNLLYITTSNRDGRGAPDSKDDKIIRVNPSKL
ncbi:MAG: PQQ-dependent sugar dehydrogenase [Candidatus Levybacteria bacterium]|nr:PQQ-dependent sugar dehydrogenase [Candidatus Levybacteria bacterium]